ILTTYGSWLYGDERGFRTRHHREHIEGDYKKPPPIEKHATQLKRSQILLKQPPVILPIDMRSVVGLALLVRITNLGGFVLRIAVAGQHVHLLMKIPLNCARSWTGLAKKHAWFVLRDHGWKGKLWGKRGKAIRIRTQDHQQKVYRYIGRHSAEGAWLWTWKKSEEDNLNDAE
ncbi:MAG: hypothetical protein IID46_15455, partial [Planctomycetes bacterium]|nr:hypothetical protein [Planctomycetota bacterium]